jgi:hypothetical protein
MKAFPTPTFSINDEARVTSVGGDGGMDLRDYFAAKVMQAILTNHKLEDCDDDVVARNAYQMADFMMEARKSESPFS